MSDRNGLLASIAERISGYRSNEIPQPTVEHVERWVEQFDKGVQLSILSEMDFVFKKAYYSKQRVKKHLDGLIDLDRQFTPRTATLRESWVSPLEDLEEHKPSPQEFWPTARVLDIQNKGRSQKEIKSLFGDLLREKLKLQVDECGLTSSTYIYLDDFLFSGNTIKNDLTNWIENENPARATVHIIVMAAHALGKWHLEESLKKKEEESGKVIRLHLWPGVCFENRKAYRNDCEVLWPTSMSLGNPELASYVEKEEKFPFSPREPGGHMEHNIFSSKEGRQILENEMSKMGIRILSYCSNPDKSMRPLGYSQFGLGFGSMLATYRNCPNNVPLAIWWGDPEAPHGHPFKKWYPLLPRKTNRQTAPDAVDDFDDIFW